MAPLVALPLGIFGFLLLLATFAVMMDDGSMVNALVRFVPAVLLLALAKMLW